MILTLLRGGLLLAAGCAALVLERKRRARTYVEDVAVHTGRNLTIAGIAAATVQAVEAPVVMPLARMAERGRWGLTGAVRPLWLRDVLAVLLLDYTLYLWHVVVHRVPWLWRFHLAHHADLDLDASTGLRFHAGELAASVPWRAAQIVAIGVSPRALTAWQSLTIVSVLFHHSNTKLDSRFERLLSWIVATPRMHAIHHSIDPDQLQTNFSSGLGIWDRLHGTFRFDAEPQDIVVGVAGHLNPADVSLEKVLKMPFVDRAEGSQHAAGQPDSLHAGDEQRDNP